MRWLGRFATRNPRPVLLVWAVVFAVALVVGAGARNQVHETNLQIPGSASARAAQLTRQHFGGTIAMAILLKGPPALLEREGPQIVSRLEQIEGVDVLSPWAATGTRTRTDPPGQALLTLQVRRPFRQISDETTPAVERVLAQYARAPLQSELTGQAPLMRALNEVSLDSLDRGELLALPVLLVMLMLIFRSPLAALVPAFSGLLVTRIGTAVMAVVGRHVEIDALALNLVAMIGLALGVDYSLLIVSRFREELASGRGVADAVEEVTARAGRTVLFAGTALTVGMLCMLAIAPGVLLVSSALGVIVATLMAVTVALFAMPALLAVIGTNVNRWQFGGARDRSPWVAIAERALRRPGAAAFFTLLPLVLLAAPALAFHTGPPNVANLPPGNAARKAYEDFARLRGPGWATPYEVDFATDGPITTTRRLAALQRFQDRASRLPGAEAVMGPAALRDSAAVLRDATRQALSAVSPIARLERGLHSAAGGTALLRDGLAAGADGASQLVGGLDQAASGSSQLAGGIAQAAPATRQLADGVARTHTGAAQLAKGVQRIDSGTVKLQQNLDVLRDSLADEDRHASARLVNPLDAAQSQVQDALRFLGSVGPAAAADPNVQKARDKVAQALTGLGDVALNLSTSVTIQGANATAARGLSTGTARLRKALGKLSTGSDQLAAGIGKTAKGTEQLAAGTRQLSAGAGQLDAGLHALLDGTGGNGGARALADGLGQAVDATTQLGQGVNKILGGVVQVRQRADRQQAQLRKNGTDVNQAIDSGYFVLAAIEGTSRQTQTNTSFATNVKGGAGVARVFVVPRKGPFDPASAGLGRALQREADTAARAMGGTAVVGGPAVLLDDFNRATRARFPLLVLTLVVVTLLVLLLLFRSPVLALCAVLLNLVTVGAAVGVLVICFQGSAPLLGGPGYLDAIALSGIFAVVFGLSIDYEVFLISRLLEGRARTGTTEGAIHYGLEKTGTIITGAAFIMAGVFLTFAISPVTNTRQFGVGLTVAVLLDATVVRLILLPALIRLFGERTWHVPAWLDRVLPRISAH